MKCVKCGSKVSIRAKFCGQCGGVVPPHDLAGAASEAKEYAADLVAEGRVAAKEAAMATKAGMKTEMGKSVAACAALGAIIAVPIPIIGPMMGAAIGAGFGFLRKL